MIPEKKPGVKSESPKSKKRIANVASPQSGSPILGIDASADGLDELRALSSRQEAILAAVPDILMEVDNDKVYTWANPAGIKFFGEDVIGKKAVFFFEGEQETYKIVNPLFDGSEDVIYVESWQRRKDGEKRLLAWRYRVLKDVNGDVTGALSSAHDITESKRAEAERQVLMEIMHGMAVTENLQELLELIHHSIAKVIYAENFLVVFHDNKTGLFEEVYTVDKYDMPMPPSKLERSITSYVFRTGEPLFLTKAGFDELAARGEVELVGTKPASWLGAPLKTPAETIGVIVVQNYKDPDCYSERDREFFASVGLQVTLAIERKRAEEALKKSQEETAHANRLLLALNQAAQAVQRSHTIEEVYRAIQNQLTQLGYFTTGFEILEEDQLLHITYINYKADLVRKAEKATGLSLRDFRFHPGIDSIYHRVMVKSETVFVEDAAQAVEDTLPKKLRTLARRITHLFKLGPSIFTPLKVGVEMIGILAVTGPDLSTTDNPGIAAFANQAAIALQNARLYEQAQQEIVERKQAEDALRKSELSLQAVLQSTADGILAVGGENEVLYANERFAELWRIPQSVMASNDDSILLQHVLDQLSDPQSFLIKVQELYKSDEESFDTLKFKDGRVFERLSRPLMQGTKVRGRVWSFRDITERKQAEEQIRLSEERYRMLADNMSDTVWLMDMSLRTSYISPSVTRLRGFTLDELNNIPLDRQMPPDSLQRALHLFAEILSPKNLAQPGQVIFRNIDLELYKKDGDKFWSEITFTLIRDPQGQPFAILGSGRDINERKKAQETLQNSEKYFRALTENNTDAVVLIDPRGLILYESPAYARMSGWVLGERLGRSGFELIHAEDKGIVAHILNELVQHPGETRHATFRSQHKDGSWRWIEGTATNLLGESAIQGLIINMHDITERRQAEEEIRRRVADLEVLYENGLSISVLLEPRIIAQKMIEILSQKLDWNHATIRLYHPETRRLELLALNEPGLDPDATQAEIQRLNKVFASPNMGLSGWVILHSKTVRSGDVQTDKRYFSAFPDIRSGLYVPLIIGERAIGSIAVESRQVDRFSEDDERLLQTLAAQSAIAFENARLYQDALSASKRKAALHQGGLEIVRAGQDIEMLCLALHQAAQQVMPAELFIVSLITEDGHEVEAPFMFDRGIRYPNSKLPVNAGITGRVIKSKKSLRIKDVQKIRGVKPIMVDGAEPSRAVLSVPLLAQDKIIGVISAQSREPDVYNAEDQIFLETLASSAAIAIENARLFTETQERLHRLSALHSIDAAIGASVDTSVTLNIVLENIMTELKGDAAAVLLFNPLTRMLEYATGRGFHVHTIEGVRLRLGEGLAGLSALQRRAINIADLQKVDEVEQVMEHPVPGSASLPLQYLEGENFVAYHAIPLIAKGQIQGVLEIFRRSPMQVDQEWTNFFEMLAGQTAIAIDNGRLFENLQQSNLELTLAYDATIQGWSQALELRDEDTEGHTLRVTDLTLSLIQAMGIEEVETEHARRGSLLHDIGKIAIPDSILLKPGPLDEREWSVMRQHPQYAYNLLFPITYLRPAIHIPYCHHEKWDGSGYPRGIKGEEIPIVARIFAIVDVYDALISNRPYRPAWTREKAMEYIREQAGMHFDPKVVKAFMTLMAGEK
jgi:PAS domain S-box-containing protein